MNQHLRKHDDSESLFFFLMDNLTKIRKVLASNLGRFLPRNSALWLGRKAAHTSNLLRCGDWWFPQQVFIEISEKCNRKCWYCPNGYAPQDGKNKITDEIFDLALDRLREIQWAGPVCYHRLNEPLLDKRLVQFVERTIRVLPASMPTIFTNGDFLTEDLAKQLLDAGVSKFVIARHPPYRQSWDDRVIPIIRNNLSTMRMIQVGIDTPMGLPNQPWLGKCVAPTVAMLIYINGDIGPCCSDVKKQVALGNIKTQSLMDIWNNPTWKDARKRLRSGERVFDICKECPGFL